MTQHVTMIAFSYVHIQRSHSMDDHFEAVSDDMGEFVACAADAVDLHCTAWLSNEWIDWSSNSDAELVRAIEQVQNACQDEPDELVAYRVDGEVRVFGLNGVSCYALRGGDYVSVEDFKARPERYTLLKN